MIFIDSNVPMYLVGAAHPHKADVRRALERMVSADERLVTDAEVLQEILHRYSAIDRLDAIQPALDTILGIIDEVYPVDRSDVERAARILGGSYRLSARDALHVAIMERHGVDRILSYDRGFDTYPGLTRLT